jgi:hypothetical protein
MILDLHLRLVVVVIGFQVEVASAIALGFHGSQPVGYVPLLLVVVAEET